MLCSKETFASSIPPASVNDDPCNEEGCEAGKDGGAHHECNQYWDCNRVRWLIGRIVGHFGPLQAAKFGKRIVSLKSESANCERRCEAINLKEIEVELKAKERQQVETRLSIPELK